jgi:hypothetical protein
MASGMEQMPAREGIWGTEANVFMVTLITLAQAAVRVQTEQIKGAFIKVKRNIPRFCTLIGELSFSAQKYNFNGDLDTKASF